MKKQVNKWMFSEHTEYIKLGGHSNKNTLVSANTLVLDIDSLLKSMVFSSSPWAHDESPFRSLLCSEMWTCDERKPAQDACKREAPLLSLSQGISPTPPLPGNRTGPPPTVEDHMFARAEPLSAYTLEWQQSLPTSSIFTGEKTKSQRG